MNPKGMQDRKEEQLTKTPLLEGNPANMQSVMENNNLWRQLINKQRSEELHRKIDAGASNVMAFKKEVKDNDSVITEKEENAEQDKKRIRKDKSISSRKRTKRKR